MTDTVSTLHVSRSADRALTLLDLVVSEGVMTLAEAAAAAGIPPSTALRHLRALTAGGWLSRRETGHYTSGPTLTRIALRSLRAGPYAQLTAAAQPHLEALVEATQETAYLAIRDGRSAVYIATVESKRSVRHVGWVGKEAPIDGTAIGQSLLATMPSAGEPLPIAMNTGASEPDVTAVTVPIFDGKSTIAAFSVLGPADRLHTEKQAVAAEALRRAAGALSAELTAHRLS